MPELRYQETRDFVERSHSKVFGKISSSKPTNEKKAIELVQKVVKSVTGNNLPSDKVYFVDGYEQLIFMLAILSKRGEIDKRFHSAWNTFFKGDTSSIAQGISLESVKSEYFSSHARRDNDNSMMRSMHNSMNIAAEEIAAKYKGKPTRKLKDLCAESKDFTDTIKRINETHEIHPKFSSAIVDDTISYDIQTQIPSDDRLAAFIASAIDRTGGGKENEVYNDFISLLSEVLFPVLAYNDFAICVRNPNVLKYNQRFALSNDTGPALETRSGETVYAVNSIIVPREWVEDSPKWDKEQIKKTFGEISDVDRRRAFIEIIGLEKLLEIMNAKVVHSEGNYEVVKTDPMHSTNSRRDAEYYLKMKNPSLDNTWHIEGIDPELANNEGIITVDQALRFRNGLTNDMIDDENGADWYQQGDVLIFPNDAQKLKSRPTILT